jgi:3-deoxy-manno-octulosonate cytidylyltransferase (CMP-KDO synthetase)
MTDGFHVVIPARFGSTRLPEKALALIAGKPMVVHVWEKAIASGALEVIVATDDHRIAEVITNAGGVAMMTSQDHETGTDRLAEVARRRDWPTDAIVVNLQGDEPLVPPALPRVLASALRANTRAGIATFATPIHEARDVFSTHVVKAVLDRSGFALYFSRAPIPFARDSFENGAPQELPKHTTYLRHLGLYAYRAATLRALAEEPRAASEKAESLEQLRALDMGVAIHVTVIDEAPPHGVDTAIDLERVRRVLES